MEKKWIKTEQMLEVLKSEPNVEQQYCHYLGGILRSTHWLEYSSTKNLYGDSTNWDDYTWYSESEFLEIHAGEWWKKKKKKTSPGSTYEWMRLSENGIINK